MIEIPRTPIPNDPALGNVIIYSQPVSLDTDATTKALVMTQSAATIDSSRPAPLSGSTPRGMRRFPCSFGTCSDPVA